MKGSSLLALAAAIVAPAFAQQPAWAQCGGIGWTGGTTCVSGYTCKYSNDYYSQCVPGTASPTQAPTTTRPPTSTTTKGSTGTPTGTPVPGTVPWWFGVNLSGAEFGEKNFSGVYGREFIWYDKKAIDVRVRSVVDLVFGLC